MAGLDYEAEKCVRQFAEIYRDRHRDKRDRELSNTIFKNSQMVLALPSNQYSEMLKYTGETRACQELLEERKRERQKEEEQRKQKEQKRKVDEDFKKTWKFGLEKRRERAILKLPAYTSLEGQIVLAILEDDGPKTQEELSGWCEELSKIDSGELKKILEGLVKEGFATKNYESETYQFLAFADENLFPLNTNSVAWETEMLDKTTDKEQKKAIKEIFQKMNKEKTIISSEDFSLHQVSAAAYYAGYGILKEEVNKKTGTRFYYYAMFGEGEEASL